MGKDWDAPWKQDGLEPPDLSATDRQKFQAWCVLWLREAFRVLKPGGIIKVFGGTRMKHRMEAAVEEAGFELLDEEAWGYGQGFPKSLDISKAVDKLLGGEPEDERNQRPSTETDQEIQAYLRERRKALGLTRAQVDKQVFGSTTRYSWVEGRGGKRAAEVYLPTPEEWISLKQALQLDDRYDAYILVNVPSRENRYLADGGRAELVAEVEGDYGYQQNGDRWDGGRRVTKPKTREAQEFEGYGTALKPAWEPFVVGRKPV
jgi:hypothetical protein